MLGIILTLVAALLVICSAFYHTEPAKRTTLRREMNIRSELRNPMNSRTRYDRPR